MERTRYKIPLSSTVSLAQKAAWNFRKENPALEWDDLFQEACLAALEAERTYNPDKGTKRTTWIWHQMLGRMQDLRRCAQGKAPFGLQVHGLISADEREQLNTSETEPLSVPFTPPLSETLEGLSKEAKQICKMILSSPQEYAGIFSREIRGSLYRTLRKKGWTWNKVWGTFRELKTHFSS